MRINGSGMYSKNFRLRLLLVVFMGIAAFSSVLYWRTKTLDNAQYVQLTIPRMRADALKAELRSANYQIDVQDSSPSVK